MEEIKKLISELEQLKQAGEQRRKRPMNNTGNPKKRPMKNAELLKKKLPEKI